MKNSSYLFKIAFMSGISLSTIPLTYANQTPIDVEREKIIIFNIRIERIIKKILSILTFLNLMIFNPVLFLVDNLSNHSKKKSSGKLDSVCLPLLQR